MRFMSAVLVTVVVVVVMHGLFWKNSTKSYLYTLIRRLPKAERTPGGGQIKSLQPLLYDP